MVTLTRRRLFLFTNEKKKRAIYIGVQSVGIYPILTCPKCSTRIGDLNKRINRRFFPFLEQILPIAGLFAHVANLFVRSCMPATCVTVSPTTDRFLRRVFWHLPYQPERTRKGVWMMWKCSNCIGMRNLALLATSLMSMLC